MDIFIFLVLTLQSDSYFTGAKHALFFKYRNLVFRSILLMLKDIWELIKIMRIAGAGMDGMACKNDWI